VVVLDYPRIENPVQGPSGASRPSSSSTFTYSVGQHPYSSLTPELTADYNERSSLNGFRFMFAVVGTLIGAVAVGPIIAAFGGGPGLDSSPGYSMVGLIFALIMMITAMTTALTVREPGKPKEAKPEKGLP